MTNFFGGGGRQTNPTPPATQLRVQTAVQGTPIPIGWGANRIAPNLIYYNDFKATQVQQSSGGGKGAGTGGGGKGGGGGTQTNYSATVVCGLCEGPIIGVGTQAGSTANVFGNGVNGFFFGQFNNPVVQSQTQALINQIITNTTTTAIGNGVWVSGNISSLAALNFALFTGSYTQTAWSFVTTNHPADARAYRGIAYVAAAPFNLSTSPELPSLNFEVLFGFFEPSNTTLDSNPRDFIVDFLTNNKYGLLFPSSRIGDTNLSTLYNYCQAVGIWMSPILSAQKSAQSFMMDVMYGCVAEPVWSNGLLKVVPYYDAAASGHGATFTPNLSPIYDLTDDDFMGGGNNNYQSPVVVSIKAVSDIYNNVKVQYLDRNYNYAGAAGTTPDYNPTVIEVKDDASIQQFTLRARDTKQLDLFCYGPAAMQCALLQLGREQVITTYQFSLGAKFVLLEPMDLVTLTDTALGLSRKLVRIKEITENQDYTLTFLAEDMLTGSASSPLFGAQAGSGFVLNSNIDPGLTLQPSFFEPTDQLAGGLEVWMAVAGANLPAWGGCNVYVSYDGVSYMFAGQQLGPARMGVTTAPLPAVVPSTTPPTIDTSSTLSVDLAESGSQLTSGTQADLLGLATLCYVGGELLAYRDATPTGANSYNLTTLSRGAYGTTATAVPSGTTLVRIDSGVFKIPFTQDRIGQTLFVKLVNFNHYGAGPQTLASVAAYAYTIQGTALTSPLPDVQNFTTNYQSNITLFAWDEIKDFRNPIDYEIRKGADWASGQVIGRYLHPNVPAIGLTPQPTMYLIKAHCQPLPGLDVYSADAATISVSGAVIPLNIVKRWDEFSVVTGVLTGTFAGNAYNNGGVIETFGAGDLYAVPNIYDLIDWYSFQYGITPSDVYTIADVYQVSDFYFFGTSNVVFGTYTTPVSHVINVGRSVGCLVDVAWTAEGIPSSQNIFDWTNVFIITDIFGSAANAFIKAWANINVSSDGVFDGDVYAITDVYAVPDIWYFSATSSGWQRYRAGFYVGRAFAIQMYVESDDPNTIASVSALSYAVHIPARIDHYISRSITAGGITITFTPDGSATAAAFNGGPGGDPTTPGLPVWQATITNEVAGDILTVSALSLSSAFVAVTNGGPVTRTVNIEFAGY